jgi:hypothetical protein
VTDGVAGARFAVRIDSAVLDEDLTHATDAGRTAIRQAVRAIGEGVPFSWLKRCQAEGRDGTRLPGCVKFYIPQPDGKWGAVLTADTDSGATVLVLLAVGERHPTQPWRPSVYQVAHARLNS